MINNKTSLFRKSTSKANLKHTGIRVKSTFCLFLFLNWFGSLYFCFIHIIGTCKWATTFLYVELEHFFGPSPKPQTVLNHWNYTLILNQASGYYIRRSLCQSLAIFFLSLPTKWCMTQWANNSAPGLRKIPDHIFWKILITVFFHISYNFAPIKKHVLTGEISGALCNRIWKHAMCSVLNVLFCCLSTPSKCS